MQRCCITPLSPCSWLAGSIFKQFRIVGNAFIQVFTPKILPVPEMNAPTASRDNYFSVHSLSPKLLSDFWARFHQRKLNHHGTVQLTFISGHSALQPGDFLVLTSAAEVMTAAVMTAAHRCPGMAINWNGTFHRQFLLYLPQQLVCLVSHCRIPGCTT